MAKYLRKNEFRMDLNKRHYGKEKKPHPAYITAERGNFYKANTITHSVFLNNGHLTEKIKENPNKRNNQQDYKTYSRISPPFWQYKGLFSKNTLKNYRYSRQSRYDIKKYNKKFYK